MVEELAHDYANYLKQSTITKQIEPICASIEEMHTRLEEFDNLLSLVRTDSAISIVENVPKIEACKQEFSELCQRIDHLEKFLTIVDTNLTQLDDHVTQAEEELGINDAGIKGFLKPLFGKSKSDQELAQQNIAGKVYVPVEIFKTTDYF